MALAASLSARPVFAGPTALFWHSEADTLSEGGADVPGQITGRLQVRRPASLGHATRPEVRVDYSAQNPLAVVQADKTIAEWKSDVLSQQLIVPVGSGERPSAWTIGILREKVTDRIRLEETGRDAGVEVTSRQTTLGLARKSGRGWIVGGYTGWSDGASSASGSDLRDALNLPAKSTSWPSVSSDSRSYGLGIARQTGRLGYGLQYSWARPRQTLSVTNETLQYTAPMAASSHGREAYLSLARGASVYFAAAGDSSSASRGRIFTGIAGRGDVQLSTEDKRWQVGWRRTRPHGMDQVLLDWRRSSYSTFDQGYVGAFPGIGADIYGLKSSARLSTLSLRYGRRQEFLPQWALLTGLSLHLSDVDGFAKLRKSRGLTSNPETLLDYSVQDGVAKLIALTLGLECRRGGTRAAFTCSGAYAKINRAFQKDKQENSEGPSRHLRARPFWAMTLERAF